VCLWTVLWGDAVVIVAVRGDAIGVPAEGRHRALYPAGDLSVWSDAVTGAVVRNGQGWSHATRHDPDAGVCSWDVRLDGVLEPSDEELEAIGLSGDRGGGAT
jgi:hypothetical protein